MSILFENENGYFISHRDYINQLYIEMDKPLKINPKLFDIREQYKSHKTRKNKLKNCGEHEVLQKEQEYVKFKFDMFITECSHELILDCHETGLTGNKGALECAEFVYNMSGKILVKNAHGANIGPAAIKIIDGNKFLFPQNCMFFSKDIGEMEICLKDKKYDLILLDPPWWNKYIRRKTKKSGDAYKMMFNSEIKNLPIDALLKDSGMVIVWCTNSQQHINYLLTEIFPKWNVKYIGKWYWVKITLSGKPVCTFSMPPGKQPYEQIILGYRGDLRSIPVDGKLVVSVPSAIHSHKPPLIELVKTFLPDNPSCLEVFARYLLSNWTSYGNEVIRLQHESAFITV